MLALPFCKKYFLLSKVTGRKKAEKRNFFTPKVMDHVELSNLGEKSPNCFIAVLAEANCTSPAEDTETSEPTNQARKSGKWGKNTLGGELEC